MLSNIERQRRKELRSRYAVLSEQQLLEWSTDGITEEELLAMTQVLQQCVKVLRRRARALDDKRKRVGVVLSQLRAGERRGGEGGGKVGLNDEEKKGRKDKTRMAARLWQ